MPVKLTDKDRGFKDFVKRAKEASGPRVKVGILEAKSDSRMDKLTNAEVGTFHEFGTEKIPQRSFIRGAMDNHKAELATYGLNLKFDFLTGKKTLRQALGLLGTKAMDFIKNNIAVEHKGLHGAAWKDISDATKKEKGSSGILIDTGQLVQSISYEVSEDGS